MNRLRIWFWLVAVLLVACSQGGSAREYSELFAANVIAESPSEDEVEPADPLTHPACTLSSSLNTTHPTSLSDLIAERSCTRALDHHPAHPNLPRSCQTLQQGHTDTHSHVITLSHDALVHTCAQQYQDVFDPLHFWRPCGPELLISDAQMRAFQPDGCEFKDRTLLRLTEFDPHCVLNSAGGDDQPVGVRLHDFADRALCTRALQTEDRGTPGLGSCGDLALRRLMISVYGESDHVAMASLSLLAPHDDLVRGCAEDVRGMYDPGCHWPPCGFTVGIPDEVLEPFHFNRYLNPNGTDCASDPLCVQGRDLRTDDANSRALVYVEGAFDPIAWYGYLPALDVAELEQRCTYDPRLRGSGHVRAQPDMKDVEAQALCSQAMRFGDFRTLSRCQNVLDLGGRHTPLSDRVKLVRACALEYTRRYGTVWEMDKTQDLGRYLHRWDHMWDLLYDPWAFVLF